MIILENRQMQVAFFVTLLTMFQVQSAIITSVNYVFEGFSPYSMVRFFEFNDRGWNISENCLRDTYNFLEGLRKGSIWAIKLYDATSYYSGAAYGSNNFRIHNPHLCRNLEFEYNDMLGMHWNLRLNTTVVPFPVTIILAKYKIEMASPQLRKSEKIQQMVCLPKSCKDADLLQILDIFMFQSNHIVKNITFLQHRIVSESFDIFQDGCFYTILALIGTSLLMYTLSHISNYCPVVEETRETDPKTNNFDTKCNILEEYEKLRKCINLNSTQFIDQKTVSMETFTARPRLSKVTPFDALESKGIPKRSILKDLNDAVSLPNILFELLKQDNDAEMAMNGTLSIFSIFLIYAHTCAQMEYISNNKNDFSHEHGSFGKYIKNQATYLYDAFFFISGSSLTYNFYKIIPNGNWNVFEQLMHLVTMFANKICGISLSYAFLLITHELASKSFHFNNVLEIPSYDYNQCEIHKWRNILYIDTFLPLEERCMPWTWFISIQMQFFAVGCLLLLLAQIHPKYASVICSALFIASLVASVFLELSGFGDQFLETMNDDLTEFNLIYDKVWLRVPLYVLGMCLGYILHKTNGYIKINVIIFVCGWIACCLIACFFLFGYHFILFRANSLTRACVITLGHTMWAMIIFWIILASTTQHGGLLRRLFSFELMNIIGKFSTNSLIVAPFIIRTILVAGEVPFNTTDGQVFLMFIGFCVITYMFALVLYILFDSPLRAILSVITKPTLK